VPDNFQRLKLTNSTTIQGDREPNSAGTDSTGYWEVIEFPAASAGGSTEYQLRYDGSRDTTILEYTPARVRLRVNGCLDTGALGRQCLTDGTDNILVTEEYTFTPEGMFVFNSTDFQTVGIELDSTNPDDGYNWMMVEVDETDAAFDDTANIYFGNGTTEISTSTDGTAVSISNVYAVLPGHGTGTYQSAQIGLLDVMADGTDDWYWDEDVSGEVDRLSAREQGMTPTGVRNASWYFQLRPKADLDTEAERER